MALNLFAVLFASGIGTHLLIFKHFEHHLYTTKWIQAFSLIFAASIIVQSRYFESSVNNAIQWSISTSCVFLSGLFCSLITYRLFFNPLNSIPGPYLARLTRFNMVFRVLSKHDSHHQLRRLHKKYGKYVRTGPNDLSVADPEAIYIIHGAHTVCRKAPWYDGDYPYYSLQSTRSRQDHDSRRRVWAPAFSDRALRGYESRIEVYNGQLVQQIERRLGQPLNMSTWSLYWSFDVMGDLGFGASFDLLLSGKDHWAIKLLKEGMSLLGIVLPLWLFCFLAAVPVLSASYQKFIQFCNQQIDARVLRQESNKDGHDIAHHLIQEADQHPDKAVATINLHADSRLIIVAGSDTTSATLTHLLYHLARDKTLLRRLREEIDSRMDGKEMTHLKLQDAPFLNGCIKETLRLNPPVPSGVFRQTPTKGIMIGYRHIPGHTVIQIPTFVLGHDNEIYPSAEEFVPERWSSRPELIQHKDAFQPFSSGAYACIGKNLALMEIRLVVARLVMLFDITFAPGESGERLLTESKDHFVMELAPLELVFTRRK